MKALFLFIVVFGFLPGLSLRAEDAVGPCKKIKAACEAAGYKKGFHKKNGKGLYVDCLNKLMSGGSVEGVSVSSDDVSACKEKREMRKAKRAAH